MKPHQNPAPAVRPVGTITIAASRKIRDSAIVTRERSAKPASQRAPIRCLCCGGLASEVRHAS